MFTEFPDISYKDQTSSILPSLFQYKAVLTTIFIQIQNYQFIMKIERKKGLLCTVLDVWLQCLNDETNQG